ncbi:hypothetical protein Ancab_028288 [Ancistrocladus abbreviatus]
MVGLLCGTKFAQLNPNLKIPIISSSLPWTLSLIATSAILKAQYLSLSPAPRVHWANSQSSGSSAAEWVDIWAVGGREILGHVARAHGSFAAKLATGSTSSFATVVATN